MVKKAVCHVVHMANIFSYIAYFFTQKNVWYSASCSINCLCEKLIFTHNGIIIVVTVLFLCKVSVHCFKVTINGL